MTSKRELLDLLAAKEDAAKAEMLEELEAICRLPGADLDGDGTQSVSRYRKLSELYKRMPAYGELAQMVGGLWPNDPEPIPETQRAVSSDDEIENYGAKKLREQAEFFGEGTQVHPPELGSLPTRPQTMRELHSATFGEDS